MIETRSPLQCRQIRQTCIILSASNIVLFLQYQQSIYIYIYLSICLSFFLYLFTHFCQGVFTQLLEQITSLNDRMDEFTNRIEEMNSKLTIKRNSPSQQNISAQADTCNGSAPTSYFISSLGNGSLTGSIMPNSSSSSQLAKESPLMEEVLK